MTRRNGNPNGNGARRNGRSGQLSTTVVPGDIQDQDGQLEPTSSRELVRTETFDQPVILQQPSIWSRAIVWGIVGVASFSILWAAIAKIEEAVPATGQLQPQGQVQPIQAPVGGVVEEIYVTEGQHVKKGDPLIRFDPTAAEAEQQSLEQILELLKRQNQFYRSQLNDSVPLSVAELQRLNLPPEIRSLTVNRDALLAEIQLYESQLSGSLDPSLPIDQQRRLESGLNENRSRVAAAELEVSQLNEQLNQVRTQLTTARETLTIDQQVLGDLETLLEEGGIQRLQVVRQRQQVLESQSKVEELNQEEQRLLFARDQAEENLDNTVSVTETELRDRIADNQEQIESIDTQLYQRILDNEARIAETTSQLSQAEQNLRYQELVAPTDGIVFDIQAKGTGFVANSTEPILKIVPENALIAEVYVTNKDIGFISEGMEVDIRIDTFPFSEFGDIEGKIVNIGSDALPPDQINQFYRFPIKVEMDSQVLQTGGREIPLQSGMSITANIITRDRTVLSIFTDQFQRQVDNIKTVR
ncbi:MAG: HlyD family efflux transporter periplasmic adaptor subunit [Cyanobacteria bacterium CRU_2_1]|nr:HlyD family efflux transporter periplasmic adaptor subunit [Cyanobacteria bacterium RU_5_0]NJR60247.1 HlyD family efflux transporter periplasmic adaptor subunit [Cyanobacteria bacterium CRU_2_1]